MTSKLLKAVRTTGNLYSSWTTVRSNVLASGRDNFKKQVKQISENPNPLLGKLHRQLRSNSFSFEQQRGVLKTKRSGSKRGLVVAPISNRIVQRALLNVLQSEDPRIAQFLGRIPEILRTPTSIGGVPERGVPTAIRLIQNMIDRGATHFIKSDIKSFFDKVPKEIVLKFVHRETGDTDFTSFLQEAISTDLENYEEVKELIDLFPIGNIGVPQGSSLSAFAANVVLSEFDTVSNSADVKTVRYIDDFLILGTSEQAVWSRFRRGLTALNKLGLSAYSPGEDSQKAKFGTIVNGFEFLGCSIRGKAVAPSREAKRKLEASITAVIEEGKRSIEALSGEDSVRRAQRGYVQTLALIDNKIRGWGDSFSFCTDRIQFTQLDSHFTAQLLQFNRWFSNRFQNLQPQQKRRAWGIALLADTPR